MRKNLFTRSKAGRRMITALLVAVAMTVAAPLCAYAESAPPVGTISDAADGYWLQRPDGNWTFTYFDGNLATSCWQLVHWGGVDSWYYFDANSNMASGWLQLDDQVFYLHSAADGTRGHMYTGWHQIEGKWYYFHEVSDGTRGHLLTNTTTPDGYQVGADGAWIPS